MWCVAGVCTLYSLCIVCVLCTLYVRCACLCMHSVVYNGYILLIILTSCTDVQWCWCSIWEKWTMGEGSQCLCKEQELVSEYLYIIICVTKHKIYYIQSSSLVLLSSWVLPSASPAPPLCSLTEKKDRNCRGVSMMGNYTCRVEELGLRRGGEEEMGCKLGKPISTSL